jgi:hypothetical protein
MITAQKILVWFARLISLTAITFFSFFAIDQGGLKIFTTKGQFRVEGILFIVFLFLAAISTAMAFWKVEIGAYLLFFSGLFLSIFIFIIAIKNNLLVAIVMGGPFIVSAVLLYLTTIEKRSRAIMKIDPKYEK